MSTTELEAELGRERGRRDVVSTAVASMGIALALAAWGTFGESTAPDGTAEQHSATDFLVVAAIALVAALAVFGWAAPRALRRPSPGPAALTLAILALATVPVFWSGLPPIFAGGALLLGWCGRDAPAHRWLARGAMLLGALALVLDVLVYVGDMR